MTSVSSETVSSYPITDHRKAKAAMSCHASFVEIQQVSVLVNSHDGLRERLHDARPPLISTTLPFMYRLSSLLRISFAEWKAF